MSLHLNNSYDKKRGIAKIVLVVVRTAMQQEQVDMVTGDFNGAAWRRRHCEDQRRDRTIEEAFANTNLPTPDGPTTLWRPGGVPDEWSDVCWRFRNRMANTHPCAFEINREVLDIKSLPTRAAITRFGSTYCRSPRGRSFVRAKAVQSRNDRTGVHTPKKGQPHGTTCDHP